MASSIKVLALIFVLVAVTACQPARNQRQSIRLGRTRAGENFSAQQTQSGIDGKVWGTIYSTDYSRWNSAVQEFAGPSLSGLAAEDQMLGTVSPNANDTTGVRFYGNAQTTGGTSNSHAIDGSTTYIHIEIFDSNTGHVRSDGSLRPPVVVEISPELNGKISGSVLGNLTSSSTQTVSMHFEDGYGGIDMDGQINGYTFSGTISYCNLTASSSCGQHSPGMRQLGNFSVDVCGFFNCY